MREGDGADARGDIPMAGGRAAHGQPSEKGEGEKKGIKNVGAEETGGKNRTVSTEAAGVCREGRKGGRWNGAGRGRREGEEGVEREQERERERERESRW